mmetsp:Transcript_104463/g.304927  ORF Transcript_104463/g.304927 Transcript_104463/m.304927 type:complete len:421 (-) Transcript_104463:882-2144(-)
MLTSWQETLTSRLPRLFSRLPELLGDSKWPRPPPGDFVDTGVLFRCRLLWDSNDCSPMSLDSSATGASGPRSSISIFSGDGRGRLLSPELEEPPPPTKLSRTSPPLPWPPPRLSPRLPLMRLSRTSLPPLPRRPPPPLSSGSSLRRLARAFESTPGLASEPAEVLWPVESVSPPLLPLTPTSGSEKERSFLDSVKEKFRLPSPACFSVCSVREKFRLASLLSGGDLDVSGGDREPGAALRRPPRPLVCCRSATCSLRTSSRLRTTSRGEPGSPPMPMPIPTLRVPCSCSSSRLTVLVASSATCKRWHASLTWLLSASRAALWLRSACRVCSSMLPPRSSSAFSDEDVARRSSWKRARLHSSSEICDLSASTCSCISSLTEASSAAGVTMAPWAGTPATWTSLSSTACSRSASSASRPLSF